MLKYLDIRRCIIEKNTTLFKSQKTALPNRMKNMKKLFQDSKKLMLTVNLTALSIAGFAQEKKSDSISVKPIINKAGDTIGTMTKGKVVYFDKVTKEGNTTTKTSKSVQYYEMTKEEKEAFNAAQQKRTSGKRIYIDPKTPKELAQWMLDGTKGSDYLSQFPKVYSQFNLEKGEDLDSFASARWKEKEDAYLKLLQEKKSTLVELTKETKERDAEKIIETIIEKTIIQTEIDTLLQQRRIPVKNDRYAFAAGYVVQKSDNTEAYRFYENNGVGAKINTGTLLGSAVSFEGSFEKHNGAGEGNLFTKGIVTDPLSPQAPDNIPYSVGYDGQDDYYHFEADFEVQLNQRIQLFKKNNDIINSLDLNAFDISDAKALSGLEARFYAAAGVTYQKTTANHSTIADGTSIFENHPVINPAISGVVDGNYDTAPRKEFFGDEIGGIGKLGLEINAPLFKLGKDKVIIKNNKTKQRVPLKDAMLMHKNNDPQIIDMVAKVQRAPRVIAFLNGQIDITTLNGGKKMNVYNSPNPLTLDGPNGEISTFEAGNTPFEFGLPMFDKIGERQINAPSSLSRPNYYISAGLKLRF